MLLLVSRARACLRMKGLSSRLEKSATLQAPSSTCAPFGAAIEPAAAQRARYTSPCIICAAAHAEGASGRV
jgi:hypothetical protein